MLNMPLLSPGPGPFQLLRTVLRGYTQKGPTHKNPAPPGSWPLLCSVSAYVQPSWATNRQVTVVQPDPHCRWPHLLLGFYFQTLLFSFKCCHSWWLLKPLTDDLLSLSVLRSLGTDTGARHTAAQKLLGSETLGPASIPS